MKFKPRKKYVTRCGLIVTCLAKIPRYDKKIINVVTVDTNHYVFYDDKYDRLIRINHNGACKNAELDILRAATRKDTSISKKIIPENERCKLRLALK